MKDKRSNRYKTAAWILLIAGIVSFSVINIFSLFFHYSNRIHNEILNRNMEQISLLSDYIVKIIRSEMRHCTEILNIGEENFSVPEKMTSAEIVKQLQEIRSRAGFAQIGIMDQEGNTIDDTGDRWQIDDSELLAAMEKGRTYVSDVFTSGRQDTSQIMIMVPLWEEEIVKGALWGKYPISSITELVDLEEDFGLYFQIVDDKGQYISRSNSKKSFAEDNNRLLWEELERYEYLEEDVPDRVYENVKNHETGMFYFGYRGEGRYVSYEPLDINNWYVFSVMPSEQLDVYVNEIQNLSAEMMVGFSFSVALIVMMIGVMIYGGNRRISQKNRELAIKNQLFRIVLDKTQDIPFEGNLVTGEVKFYYGHRNGSREYEVIPDFSPEGMVAADRIMAKDEEKFREFYKDILRGNKIRSVVLQLKIDNIWKWIRVHVLTVTEMNVVGFLEEYNEQMDQKQQIETISQKIRTDQLTGLYNRETFIEEMEQRLKRQTTEENKRMNALFILDLDHFKELNDTLGHMMGDQALCETADRIKSSIRKTDLAGRLGGDEFVLFIQDLPDRDAVERCARKLNHALKSDWTKDGKTVRITASVGITEAEKGMDFKDLYERADRALYKAKEQGRDGYYIAE